VQPRRLIGGQANRFRIIGNGLCVIPHVLKGIRPVAVSCGVMRLQSD
jgi:hypothetical protein